MRPLPLLFALALAMTGISSASAQPAIDGYFIATSACPAKPSIRGADNPGDVRLEVDRAYKLFAQNKVPGTHYWIGVPGASPERRWVEIGCGLRVATVDEIPVVGEQGGAGDGEVTTAPGPVATAPAKPRPATGGTGGSTNNLLAISWQPAFCETRPNKDECTSQTAERFDATHFTLHGLWPQPRGTEYCRVEEAVKALDASSSNWAQLPAPEIGAATRKALEEVMPGTQSFLDRHEWTRHGTCYGDAEEYFSEAIHLMAAINASPVQALFASRIGRSVTLEEVRAAFDQGFGPGAGQRVRIACEKDGDRQLIGELTIGLSGDITPDGDVGALILAAKPTNGGCPEGIVDPVGLE